MKIFFKILFFVFLFSFISCREKLDLRNEKDAALQVKDDLQSKKIIFIGENHSDVYPIIFLTEHLEEFYDTGLRYLFLEEESDGYLENPDKLNNVFIYPPWATFGFKYEYMKFQDELLRINTLHKNDPIAVIWPETGVEINREDLSFEKDATVILNKRDAQAQKKIIEIMDSTDKPGMIFYGSGHGLKMPRVYYHNTDSEWKMLGSYLYDYYGSDYCSYYFMSFSSNDKRNVIYNGSNDCKVFPQRYYDFDEISFDYYCVNQKEYYGVPEELIPNENILNYMINFVFTVDVNKSENTTVWSDKGQMLLGIYYLKYHYKDFFDFDYESKAQNFDEAIKTIKQVSCNFKYDLSFLESYMEFIYSYGWLEDYLFEPGNDERIGYILYNMKKAKEIAPNNDIWPQYWIAYFKTEQAIYSEKKSDYKKALKEWEELFQNKLLYVSPVLKLAYEKAALCEEKTGNIEMVDYYRQKERQVKFPFEFDYREYGYFGW